MKSEQRVFLERTLQQNWLPELKAKGFAGRPWKFLRERNEFVDQVVMEFDRSGTGCRILLGVEPRNFPGAIQDEIPDFKKLRVTACQFQQYVTADKGSWFVFGDLSEDDILILAEFIIDRFDEVSKPFFQEYDSLDGLRSFSPDDLENNEELSSRFCREPRKAAVFFCKMYRYLGELDRARSFAEVGLKSKKGIFGENFMRGVLFSDLLEKTTVRARVAFALSVAEDVARRNLDNHPVAMSTKIAFGMAWQWTSGKRMLGEEFDQEIILVDSAMGSENDSNQLNAWLCARSALNYVGYCAHRAVGDASLPHPYDEMKEDESFSKVLDYAAKSWFFNADRFEPVKEQLIQFHPSSNPVELGPPLNAESLRPCHLARKGE